MLSRDQTGVGIKCHTTNTASSNTLHASWAIVKFTLIYKRGRKGPRRTVLNYYFKTETIPVVAQRDT